MNKNKDSFAQTTLIKHVVISSNVSLLTVDAGAIAGIAVGGALLVVLIIVLLIVCCICLRRSVSATF